ncbi:hypothetical protein PENSPDRAFT_693270 [Peniophora sp. CONT]|nr:hypothetical protein PENSPDRAFT_693270 [Peniophora sp. CONT]
MSFESGHEEQGDPAAHIRWLLDDYVSTHLATDYNDWTQREVYEILTTGSQVVSVTDPRALVPPSDPLLDFLRESKAPESTALEEHLPATKEAHALLRSIIASREKPYSETCFLQASQFDVDYHRSEFAPLETALSKRARRTTPHRGKGTFINRFSEQHPEYKKLPDFPPVYGEPFSAPTVDEDDVLDLRLDINAPTRQAALNLIKSNPFASKNTERSEFARLRSLREPSPPRAAMPRPMTPPIFPRSRVAATSSEDVGADSKAQTLADMTSILKPINMPEDDAFSDHLALVDGWESFTIPSSPLFPPTPSLASSSSLVDELSLPTLPTSPVPRIQEIEKAKMDDHIMPLRTGRAGSERDKRRALGQGQSFHQFLADHGAPKILTDPKSVPSSPHHDITSSIVGQPPTALVHEPTGVDGDDSDDDVERMLTLHGAVDDGTEMIMREQLGDKESEMMEVPLLPEPNEHATTGVVPTSLADLPGRPGSRGAFGVLRPVQGVKSLNMELSWRPFDHQEKLPTHDELARTTGLEDLLRSNTVNAVDPQAVRRVLKLAMPAAPSPSERDLTFLNDHRVKPAPTFRLDSLSGMPSDTIMTRRERQRALGVAGEVDDGPAPGSPDDLTLPESYSPRKRQRTTTHLEQAPQPAPSIASTLASDHPYPRNLVPAAVALSHYAPSSEGTSGSLPFIEELYDDAPVGRAGNAWKDDEQTDEFYAHAYEDPSAQAGYVDIVSSLSSNLPASSIPSTSTPEPDYYEAPARISERQAERSAVASLAEFLGMRGKHLAIGDTQAEAPAAQSRDIATGSAIQQSLIFTIPSELVNSHTLLCPTHRVRADAQHLTLASLDVLKNRALVRALDSDARQVKLAEREDLGSADLILACDLAVVFFPLSHLPSAIDELKTRLDELSWRFDHVLVIFEAYTSFSSTTVVANAFTPPVIKSARRLQTKLAVSEAYETRSPGSTVKFAYAESVEAAADLVLVAGDGALGPTWSDHDSLLVEEQEDEARLAQAAGMNPFTAALITSKISLGDFLDMAPEDRLYEFGALVGERRIKRLNAWIAEREAQIDTSSQSGPS